MDPPLSLSLRRKKGDPFLPFPTQDLHSPRKHFAWRVYSRARFDCYPLTSSMSLHISLPTHFLGLKMNTLHLIITYILKPKTGSHTKVIHRDALLTCKFMNHQVINLSDLMLWNILYLSKILPFYMGYISPKYFDAPKYLNALMSICLVRRARLCRIFISTWKAQLGICIMHGTILIMPTTIKSVIIISTCTSSSFLLSSYLKGMLDQPRFHLRQLRIVLMRTGSRFLSSLMIWWQVLMYHQHHVTSMRCIL